MGECADCGCVLSLVNKQRQMSAGAQLGLGFPYSVAPGFGFTGSGFRVAFLVTVSGEASDGGKGVFPWLSQSS